MFRCFLLLCLLCAACAPGAANEKSQFNLFNPTPDSQMRPFSTDAAPRLQPYAP